VSPSLVLFDLTLPISGSRHDLGGAVRCGDAVGCRKLRGMSKTALESPVKRVLEAASVQVEGEVNACQ
jgi:hypothetical protein